MNKNFGKVILIFLILACLVATFVACGGETTARYSITFKVPGSEANSWSTYAVVRSRGNEIVTFPTAPTKTSYVFYGWYSDENLTTEVKEYSYESTVVAADTILYAKFVASSTISQNYNVTFDTKGGSTVASKLCQFRDKLTDIASPTKSGYKFTGWYKDAELTTKWYLDYDVVRSSFTLYAGWEDATYSVSYTLNGGVCSSTLQNSYSQDNPLVLPETSTISKGGYTFAGWYVNSNLSTAYDSDTNVDSNLNLYVKWTPITYNITYSIPDGAALSAGQTNPTTYTLDSDITLYSPSKIGYNFGGWYTDSTFATKFYTNRLPVPAEGTTLTLYPKFTEKKIAITYFMNGGTNNPSNLSYYKYFDASIILYTPTKAGYSFGGWYTDEELETAFDGANNRTPVTVYASWELETYSINYVVDSGAEYNVGETNPTSYNVETEITLYEPILENYLFAGWYTNSEKTTAFDTTKTYIGDLTLYAKFVEGELVLESNCYSVDKAASINYSNNQSLNLAINIDASGVKSSNLQNDEYTYYDDGNGRKVIVIPKDFFSSYEDGDKVLIKFVLADDSIYSTYISIMDVLPYSIVAADYAKLESTDFSAVFGTAVTESNIYRVYIDDQIVSSYGYDSTISTLTISSSIMDTMTVGKHSIYVYSDKGRSVDSFEITNSTNFAPYNVRFNFEEYPKMLVEWDSDVQASYYTATIGANTYKSNIETSLFEGNSFNAASLLKYKNETITIGAYYNEELHNSTALVLNFDYYTGNSITPSVESFLNYENGINFCGKSMNRYVSSWDEYYDLAYYMLIFNSELQIESFNVRQSDNSVSSVDYKALSFWINFDLTEATNIDYTYSAYSSISQDNRVLTNSTFVMSMFQEIMYYLPESSSYSICISKISAYETENVLSAYKLGVNLIGEMGPTISRTKAEVSTYKETGDKTLTTYGSGLASNYEFPIEKDNKGTVEVNTSIQLYTALEQGYLPTIPTTNTSLISMYNKAKTILKTILDADMNDYEIVLAIYEYLAINVIYDYPLIELSNQYLSASDKTNYYALTGASSYYAEGVFENNVAVCNGIAAAFSIMSNLMGIECIKVSGIGAGGAHAWNKVKIGDYWYVSDATWANTLYNKNELVSYEYCFMTDTKAEEQHTFTAPTKGEKITACDQSLSVYKMIGFTYNGVDYDLYIDNKAEFDALVNYIILTQGNSLTSGDVVYLQIGNIYSNTTMNDYLSASHGGYSFSYLGSTSQQPQGQAYIVITKD